MAAVLSRLLISGPCVWPCYHGLSRSGGGSFDVLGWLVVGPWDEPPSFISRVDNHLLF